jgi:Ferritin-like domain
VEACEYNFGKALDNVKSFVSLGSVLEGVGVSAYSGSAAAIKSKDLLTAAAAILVTEGLHQGIQRQGLQQPASGNIVGTPASPNAIFTLASAFIGKCPTTNMALPFTAFPTLNSVQTGVVAPNSLAMFSVGGAVAEPFFMTFVSGIDTISVPGKTENGMLTAQIRVKTSGQTYAFVTKAAATGAIRDSQVLFGPAILEVMPNAPTFDLTIQ